MNNSSVGEYDLYPSFDTIDKTLLFSLVKISGLAIYNGNRYNISHDKVI